MNNQTFVVGHPIAHSRSPLIHNFWLRLHNIDGKYVPQNVAPKDLARFVETIRNGQYLGGNVTIPHKTAVTTLCDELTPIAQSVGAVNTVYMCGNKLIGTNTDAEGFLANLDNNAKGWDRNCDTVILLGAGGAARAILSALLQRGVARIFALNRTPSHAQTLVDRYLGESCSSEMVSGALEDFSRYAPSADLLVNTSAVGLNNTRFENLELGHLPDRALVTDIVYAPLVTPLLASARDRGLQIVDGLGMLLHQAAPGFQRWYGFLPEVTSQLRQRITKDLISDSNRSGGKTV